MAESDCNSVCSYDTDDSEYNFIPGHVNIDDIEVEDDENFSLGVEEAEPDPENYKPYEDEPIATEDVRRREKVWRVKLNPSAHLGRQNTHQQHIYPAYFAQETYYVLYSLEPRYQVDVTNFVRAQSLNCSFSIQYGGKFA